MAIDFQSRIKAGNTLGITMPDGPHIDSFGRIRTSNPYTHLDSQFQYDLQPTTWDSQTAGGGSVAHLPAESSVRLRVGTASGDLAVRQSVYNRYQPGKSQLALMTGVMGAKKEGVRQRIGYFDGTNGCFFEQDITGPKVVVRSSTSGVVIDTVIPQSQWNLDTMDGEGLSHVILDFTKTQIFFIDLEWLGSGRVRFGVFINGLPVYCHEALHSNLLPVVYMGTANLPIRYELENTRVTASSTDMRQICSTVVGEGGFDIKGIIHSHHTAIAGVAVSNVAETPLISIRPAATFNGLPNHAIGIILGVELINLSNVNPARFMMTFNGVLTNPNWANFGEPDSMMQVDLAATAIANGHQRYCGYVGSNTKGFVVGNLTPREPTDFGMFVHLGGAQDTFTLSGLAIGAPANVVASVIWREIY